MYSGLVKLNHKRFTVPFYTDPDQENGGRTIPNYPEPGYDCFRADIDITMTLQLLRWGLVPRLRDAQMKRTPREYSVMPRMHAGWYFCIKTKVQSQLDYCSTESIPCG